MGTIFGGNGMRLLTSTVIVVGLLVANGPAQSDSETVPDLPREICSEIRTKMGHNVLTAFEHSDGEADNYQSHLEALGAGCLAPKFWAIPD